MPKDYWTHIIIEAFCLLKHDVRTFKPLYETEGDEFEFVEIPESKKWRGTLTWQQARQVMRDWKCRANPGNHCSENHQMCPYLGYSFVRDDEYHAAVEAMMNLPETDT